MSRATLSFIYRPLLYNLLDNKLGKRIMLMIVPLFIVFIMLFTSSLVESNYHNEDWSYTDQYANKANYEDQIIDENLVFVRTASIPSKIITSNILPVYIKHHVEIENTIFYKDSTLTPNDDTRGYNFFTDRIVINFGSNTDEEPDITDEEFERYVKMLPGVLHIKLDDSLIVEPSFLLSTNIKDQLGYETVMDLKGYSRGLHSIEISRDEVQNDSIISTTIARIPFWYYPD